VKAAAMQELIEIQAGRERGTGGIRRATDSSRRRTDVRKRGRGWQTNLERRSETGRERGWEEGRRGGADVERK
jgi:hypothetical protein